MFQWFRRLFRRPEPQKSVSPRVLANRTAGLGIYAPSIAKAQEQYKHYTGWAYVAIRAIAYRGAGQSLHVGRVGRPRRKSFYNCRKISGPPWVKALGDDLEPLESHVFLRAVETPNVLMNRWALVVSTIASLKLTGRCYWWMPDGDEGRPEIWPIPSNWIEPADPFRRSYLLKPGYTGKEYPIPGDEVAPFTLTDPSNPFETTSPLQTQAPAVAADEAIQVCQYRGFKNGMFPGHLIKVGRFPGIDGKPGDRPVLEPHQRKDLIENLLVIYGGALNYGEPLILDGMIEGVERLTDKIAEMDFLGSGKVTKARILQAFGVNPLIVGEIEGANRAQAVVAERSFTQNTVNPLLDSLSQGMTRWVCPRFSREENLVAWFAPAVADDDEMELKRWEAGLRSGAVTVNEYRSHVLNLPDLEGGDEPPNLFRPPQVTRSHQRDNGHAARIVLA